MAGLNIKRYSRQFVLREVGIEGQDKLSNSSIVIVGCGGLGGEVAVHLAASGIGKIHLIDFDTVNISNLHRQVFFTESDINKSKVACLAKYISSINSSIRLTYSKVKIDKLNIKSEIEEFDIVVDCTDDLKTKFLINDASVLYGKTLIYGSLYKHEGHVAVFNSAPISKERTANLRDIYSNIPSQNIPSCSEVGTLNSIVSIIANMQCNEIYKIILGIGKPLINTLLIYNTLESSQTKVKLKVQKSLIIQEIWDKESYTEEFCSSDDIEEITFEELSKNRDYFKIISVLEDPSDFPFSTDFHIPFSSFDIDTLELPSNKYVIICQYGITSKAVSKMIKTKYPKYRVFSLSGGISKN